MNIEQMRLDCDYLARQIDGLEAQCQKDSRIMNQDEQDIVDESLTKITALQRQIKLEERRQEVKASLDAPERKPVKPALSGARAERVGEKAKFVTFRDFIHAVKQAGMPGGTIDPRLSTRAATGLNEGIASDGGFLVQTDESSALMKEVFSTGVLAPRCKRVGISTNANSLKINGIDETSRATGSRWGGVRGYWTEEAGEKIASKPKFRKIELNLHKLIGLCYATDELLQDTSAMSDILRQAFVSEMQFLIDNAIINGTGAGQPLGILNSGAVVQVAKETGQAANTIVFENVTKMWARMFAASRPSAIWVINQDVEPALMSMALAVGTGGSAAYLPQGGLSTSPYATLMGRPVLPIEAASTLGTSGDIMLLDLANGYILADKGGVNSDVSIHVRFIYDESVFRYVIRVDGQPILSAPVTPFKGTNTQSHFVKLQTRS